MYNRVLIFRTDKIGDLLAACPAILTIKKNIKNSEITLISSDINHNYAKNLEIFDHVYQFPKVGLTNKIKFIYQLSKKKFDYIFIYDTKDRSIISSIFIKSKYKFAIIHKNKFSIFCKLFKIKYHSANKNITWNSIYQESLNYINIGKNIENYDFLKIKKNNNFSSNVPIKNYIHIHLDEKWINNLYIDSYKSINPGLDEFIEFINILGNNYNILITTGIKDFSLINDLKNKYFKKKTENIYYNKVSSNFIYFIYKPTFYDLESLLRNSKILISCHGAITHAANSFDVQIIDIIEEKRESSYKLFSSHLKNYNLVYRNEFNIIKEYLINKINEN